MNKGNLLGKLGSIFKVSEDGYYEPPEGYENEYQEEEEEFDEEELYEPAPRFTAKPSKQKNDGKVLSFNQGNGSGGKFQMVLNKPKSLKDAIATADSVNAKKTVIVNLDGVRGEENNNILQFLYGVTYANHAKMRQVANSTYVIIPENVDVNGTILSELGNGGIIF
ncbi:MAG: cell division protein SepF [Ruminococcaceae bacterium]|nr:cell division protein SepF [Oscillospiraceae bacterium]